MRAVLAVLLLLSGLLSAGLAIPVKAYASTEPPASWSRYISTSDPNVAGSEGCDQGNADRLGGNLSSTVVLDFGAQDPSNYGTIRINDSAFMPYSTVEGIAESFAYNYWKCTGTDTTSTLTMAFGTSNSGSAVNNTTGSTWAAVVGAVANWFSANNLRQVNFEGGNDIEPHWSPYSAAADWVNGFSGHGFLYLNFGSADGCPVSTSGNGPCSNGWNQYDVWYLAWGAPAAMSAPEIYYSANAWQWAQISWFGHVYENGADILFTGPWDEYDLDPSTYTPAQAWNALVSDVGRTFPYALEIHSE